MGNVPQNLITNTLSRRLSSSKIESCWICMTKEIWYWCDVFTCTGATHIRLPGKDIKKPIKDWLIGPNTCQTHEDLLRLHLEIQYIYIYISNMWVNNHMRIWWYKKIKFTNLSSPLLLVRETWNDITKPSGLDKVITWDEQFSWPWETQNSKSRLLCFKRKENWTSGLDKLSFLS